MQVAIDRLLVAFFAALIAFCACDFVWLGIVARDYYQARLGALLLEQPNWIAAVVFYPLYAVGVVYFCVAPALAQDSWRRAFRHGALFGLIAYATYDLSNLATLKGWPTGVVLVDIAWGMVVSGVAAAVGFLAVRGRGEARRE